MKKVFIYVCMALYAFAANAQDLRTIEINYNGSSATVTKPDDVDDMSRVIGEALAASERFAYPDGFIARHSWHARAEELMTLIERKLK